MFPTFQYHFNPDLEHIDIILCGSSSGIDSELMQKLFHKSVEKKHSVIMFNYHYRDKNTKHSKNLKEELETLDNFVKFVEIDRFKKITFLGKSLGGIITGIYLKDSLKEKDNIDVVILGYVKDYIDLSYFKGPIRIIQGEKDPYATPKEALKHAKKGISKNIQLFEIKNAEHGYRDYKTEEPKYIDEAVKKAYN